MRQRFGPSAVVDAWPQARAAVLLGQRLRQWQLLMPGRKRLLPTTPAQTPAYDRGWCFFCCRLALPGLTSGTYLRRGQRAHARLHASPRWGQSIPLLNGFLHPCCDERRRHAVKPACTVRCEFVLLPPGSALPPPRLSRGCTHIRLHGRWENCLFIFNRLALRLSSDTAIPTMVEVSRIVR